MFYKTVLELVVAIILVLVAVWWGFSYFSDDLINFFQGDSSYQVFFDEVAMRVTVADEQAEWQQGLSGVTTLGELEGKLFIFPNNGRYGMWMKDMLIPIDIIWVDDTFTVVHVESVVTPDTYPQSFTSPVPARFVLEANAYFAELYKIGVGSTLRIPAQIIPKDLRN